MWFKSLLKHALLTPHKVALRFQKEKYVYDCLTYQQLMEEVAKKVNFFKAQDVKQGDIIAYLSKNSMEHIIYLIALNSIGAALLPLNFRLSENEILEILDMANPKLLILSKEFEECHWNKNKFKVHEINLSESNRHDLHDGYWVQEQIDSNININDETCLIMFTSGSTGRPKGVKMHSKMLETNIHATVQNWKLETSDSTIVETPFFHTGGYNVLCLPLLSIGGTCLIKEKFDAEESIIEIQEQKITVYFGVPTIFQMVLTKLEELKIKSNPFLSIKFFVSGGAAINLSTIKAFQKFNVPFKQGFGMTEIGPNCFLLEEKDAVRKMGSIGRPMSHTKALVRHEHGHECGANEIGELELGGDHLCHGYLANDAFYHECLNGDLLKTGDLVTFDEDGFFYVVGRKKNMFISGGENVFPAEVENAIDKIAVFKEAYVVPVEDEKWGEVGFCFYDRTGMESAKDEIQLKQNLSQYLSKYKIPHHWKEMNEFPVLNNGKIDRQKLKEHAKKIILQHRSI